MTTRDGTLMDMRSVLPSPSAETLAMARAIVADPAEAVRPRVGDQPLEEAARRVASELSDYDRDLMRRAIAAPENAPSRIALERAIARRIASTRLEAAAEGR